MKTQGSNPPTVAIVGGGLGGLFCGAMLAKHGVKVHIFEALPKIGGFATSWKRKDYLMEGSLHELNGFLNDKLKARYFRYLKLQERITLLPIKSPYTSITGDFKFTLPHSSKELCAQLVNQFPEEQKGITTFFTVLEKISSELDWFSDAKGFELLKAPFKMPTLMMYSYKTVHDLIWGTIANNKVRTILGQLYYYFADDVRNLNVPFFAAPTHVFLNEAYWISGTSHELAKALGTIITENNGEIHTNSRVNHIDFKGKKACGVSIDTNHIPADAVVYNGPITELFSGLINTKAVSARIQKKASRTHISTSMFSVYIGLNVDAKSLGINEYCYFLNELDDISETKTDGKLVDFDKRGIALISYNLDHSLAPEGKSVLAICTVDRIPYWNAITDKAAYNAEKKRVADILIAKVEKHFPGFTNHIDVADISTPKTMQRYSNNPEGAVYGACQRISQGGLNRFPFHLKKHALYFTSAWVSPGAGISGVGMSAYWSAEAILKQCNIKSQMKDTPT